MRTRLLAMTLLMLLAPAALAAKLALVGGTLVDGKLHGVAKLFGQCAGLGRVGHIHGEHQPFAGRDGFGGKQVRVGHGQAGQEMCAAFYQTCPHGLVRSPGKRTVAPEVY